MVRVVVMLANHLMTFEAYFIDTLFYRTLQLTFQGLFVHCFVHIAIGFAHPTDSSIGNGIPQHDIASIVFNSNLHVMAFEAFP
ncbi:hypothetical protein G6F43_013309 [Rhizopus delemar]|nr:hypothetical protein G6F43_013309 [Rhizopus delemar]